MSKTLLVLGLLIICGILVKQYRQSQVIANPYRFNIVTAAPQSPVIFISFDPEEKQVFTVTYPKELEITSRSVGSYTIGNLYTLGEYEGKPENLVRRKIQGFMRVPITGFVGYIADSDKAERIVMNALKRNIWQHDQPSTLSRVDSLVLYLRGMKYDWHESGTEELLRAQVMVKKDNSYVAAQERLKQFLGTKVFDWELGSQGATVAIINESQEDGLGGDIAEFMTNLGFDIVAVKSNEAMRTETLVEYRESATGANEITKVMQQLFGWKNVVATNSTEYRADYIIRLGRDAIALF